MKNEATFLDGYANSIADKDDWIGFTRAIYNMVGRNAPAALILNRILYWHGKSKTGKSRLQVESDGELWLAKTYDDWEEECCVNASTARKAIDRIEKLGIVETKIGKFKNKNALFIRIVADKFNELYLSKMDGSPVQNGRVEVSKLDASYVQDTTVQESTTPSSATPDGVAAEPYISVARNSAEYQALEPIVKEKIFEGGSLGKNGGTMIAFLVIQKATPDQIDKFIVWYKNKYPDANLPWETNRVPKTNTFEGKFVRHWEIWQKSLQAKTKTPAPSSVRPPSQALPALSPEQVQANLTMLRNAQKGRAS